MVEFIPRYFLLFDTSISGIVFLVSHSDSSLLMYRSAVEFCILILYLATSLNLLVLADFWWNLLEFSIYKIISSINSDSFVSSFSIWIPFTSFSCLIAVVRTSNTMLRKKIIRVGIFVLILILEEKLSAFHC